MLTRAQLALCQADAIARLARLRSGAQVRLTEQRHLSLELVHQGHQWVRETLGSCSGNVTRVLAWEATQARA